jgi:hypothetical protein
MLPPPRYPAEQRCFVPGLRPSFYERTGCNVTGRPPPPPPPPLLPASMQEWTGRRRGPRSESKFVARESCELPPSSLGPPDPNQPRVRDAGAATQIHVEHALHPLQVLVLSIISRRDESGVPPHPHGLRAGEAGAPQAQTGAQHTLAVSPRHPRNDVPQLLARRPQGPRAPHAHVTRRPRPARPRSAPRRPPSACGGGGRGRARQEHSARTAGQPRAPAAPRAGNVRARVHRCHTGERFEGLALRAARALAAAHAARYSNDT